MKRKKDPRLYKHTLNKGREHIYHLNLISFDKPEPRFTYIVFVS